jgi:hypothetical protein
VANDDTIMNRLVFSDELRFQLMGRVYQHKQQILCSQNPHGSSEYETDSLKINICTQQVVSQSDTTQATICTNIKLLDFL